ncbi:stemmadenine O-acetyltransferase-like [Salvia splendens]|uniref:stemmadenine O-acetyltransferase-like n=1 Tax=Salvia splendens TaxID=180675 RepID=UPI001C2644F2|nr:stemmadenine O-acetyltransferase-like [Salvia splendens]
MALPLALYYPNTAQKINDPDSLTRHLKRSLSVILSRYYPLAGRARGDGDFSDCNDAGVPFTVARFRGHNLSEHLTDPRSRLLLTCAVDWGTDPGPHSAVLLVQVNLFDCGGVAIGAVFWHKVVDGSTVSKEKMALQLGSTTDIHNTGRSIVTIYVFERSTVSLLKSKLSDVERPSAVEVVSALLWKCLMYASLANGKSTSLLTQTVDLRRRAQPPFPPECFGNFLGLAPTTTTLHWKMRDSIVKIDDDYINRMRGDLGLLGYYQNLQNTWTEYSPEFDILPISSLCGHNFYGVDFGWGKPIWFSRCDTINESMEGLVWNMIWLVETRNGEGIEAWVILHHKYMSIFNQVKELTTLASINPTPTSLLRSRF